MTIIQRFSQFVERILLLEEIAWRMAVDEMFQAKHKVNEREQL